MVNWNREPTKCPMCLKRKTMKVSLSWITEQPEDDKTIVEIGQFLYHAGILGKKGYLLPRCGECFDLVRPR